MWPPSDIAFHIAALLLKCDQALRRFSPGANFPFSIIHSQFS
jgi:hypothetical protein